MGVTLRRKMDGQPLDFRCGHDVTPGELRDELKDVAQGRLAKVEDIDDPKPKANEVVLKLKADDKSILVKYFRTASLWYYK